MAGRPLRRSRIALNNTSDEYWEVLVATLEAKIVALEAEITELQKNEDNPLHWERKVNRAVGVLSTDYRAAVEKAARAEVAGEYKKLHVYAARIFSAALTALEELARVKPEYRERDWGRSVSRIERIGALAGLKPYGKIGAVVAGPYEAVNERALDRNDVPIVLDIGVFGPGGPTAPPLLPAKVRWDAKK